jgi:hypothetical protein
MIPEDKEADSGLQCDTFSQRGRLSATPPSAVLFKN